MAVATNGQVAAGCPQAVLVNGEPLPRVLYEHQQAIGTWYHDTARRRVRLTTAMEALQAELSSRCGAVRAATCSASSG